VDLREVRGKILEAKGCQRNNAEDFSLVAARFAMRQCSMRASIPKLG
jgi:hypothetical protein